MGRDVRCGAGGARARRRRAGSARRTRSRQRVLARVGAGTREQHSAVLLYEDGHLALAAVHGTTASDAEDWLATHVISDQGQQLDCDRDDGRFPLRVPLRAGDREPALIGWLLLGPRPDGSFYGRDEREALAAVADPVSRGIRIVQVREAREQRALAQERRRDRRIAALERKLAELASRLPNGANGRAAGSSPPTRTDRPRRRGATTTAER